MNLSTLPTSRDPRRAALRAACGLSALIVACLLAACQHSAPTETAERTAERTSSLIEAVRQLQECALTPEAIAQGPEAVMYALSTEEGRSQQRRLEACRTAFFWRLLAASPVLWDRTGGDGQPRAGAKAVYRAAVAWGPYWTMWGTCELLANAGAAANAVTGDATLLEAPCGAARPGPVTTLDGFEHHPYTAAERNPRAAARWLDGGRPFAMFRLDEPLPTGHVMGEPAVLVTWGDDEAWQLLPIPVGPDAERLGWGCDWRGSQAACFRGSEPLSPIAVLPPAYRPFAKLPEELEEPFEPYGHTELLELRADGWWSVAHLQWPARVEGLALGREGDWLLAVTLKGRLGRVDDSLLWLRREAGAAQFEVAGRAPLPSSASGRSALFVGAEAAGLVHVAQREDTVQVEVRTLVGQGELEASRLELQGTVNSKRGALTLRTCDRGRWLLVGDRWLLRFGEDGRLQLVGDLGRVRWDALPKLVCDAERALVAGKTLTQDMRTGPAVYLACDTISGCSRPQALGERGAFALAPAVAEAEMLLLVSYVIDDNELTCGLYEVSPTGMERWLASATCYATSGPIRLRGAWTWLD